MVASVLTMSRCVRSGKFRMDGEGAWAGRSTDDGGSSRAGDCRIDVIQVAGYRPLPPLTDELDRGLQADHRLHVWHNSFNLPML